MVSLTNRGSRVPRIWFGLRITKLLMCGRVHYVIYIYSSKKVEGHSRKCIAKNRGSNNLIETCRFLLVHKRIVSVAFGRPLYCTNQTRRKILLLGEWGGFQSQMQLTQTIPGQERVMLQQGFGHERCLHVCV